MTDTYREYLRDEFKKAKKNFKNAKAESIKSLEEMNMFRAEDYGAAYASHIDKVSVYAGKLHIIAEIIRAYEYYHSDDEPVLTEEERSEVV